MNKCKHCGKEFSTEYNYCPYCAEPIETENEFTELKGLTREERVQRSYRVTTIVVAILLFLSMFFVGMFLGWTFYPGTAGNDAFCDKDDVFAIVFWLSSIICWIVFRYVYWRFTKESKLQKRVRKQIISEQFLEDPTSICPYCGSHDTKIYREGYNYNKGFWMRMAGVKGGGYIAGMNSNRARCHCINCGKDWKTNYDYRFLDK